MKSGRTPTEARPLTSRSEACQSYLPGCFSTSAQVRSVRAQRAPRRDNHFKSFGGGALKWTFTPHPSGTRGGGKLAAAFRLVSSVVLGGAAANEVRAFTANTRVSRPIVAPARERRAGRRSGE